MRIVSWNVHAMAGSDGRRDPERIARVVEELRPDVVGLQEVGLPALPSGVSDPAAFLGSLTGMRSAFGPTMHHRLGFAYGNAVLARHPIRAIRNYDLSVPGREPRGCVRADVEIGGVRAQGQPDVERAPERAAEEAGSARRRAEAQPTHSDGSGGREGEARVSPRTIVHVFAAHLGLHWRERRRQAAQLLSADILRDAALAHPLVLVGDFNSLSNRSAVPRWLRRQLLDAALAARNEAPTFPAPFPLLRLDHCYVDSAFRVIAVEVHRSALARRASDHLPLVVELEILPAARRPPAARPIEAAGVSTIVHPARRPVG